MKPCPHNRLYHSDMANTTIFLPLQERIAIKNTIQRAVDIIIFLLLLCLLSYRLLSLINNSSNHGITWFLALLCESWFTFTWVLVINVKWNRVDRKTYPERLLNRIHELPPVDLFVTTADPVLEPPIITVNTVLSLLAVDYPANKLACYVSDDGASPITFYSLVEAIKFAKFWIPFCKKYDVGVRAPFQYFSSDEPRGFSGDFSLEFKQDWRKLKNEYDLLSRKIEEAVQNYGSFDLAGEFADFSGIERRNHPSIVKVIWENKENLPDGVPHLIYVSREKRLKHPHHFKAGAMNVLTRVSAVMTNSPIMLNVDCDMFANNSKIVLHAMCLLRGTENERECAFVQSPQIFYGGPKDDPFGIKMLEVLQKYVGKGIVGIQGPFYAGTGCFHRRKIIYGQRPDEARIKRNNFSLTNENLHREDSLETKFGYSTKFTKSVAQLFSGLNESVTCPNDISSSLKAATQVADCSYEYNTHWGSKVGWIYGSTTEDVLTGLRIHAKGWKTVYCTPDPPAFLGCAPTTGPSCMVQQKRWVTGLLEILFSKNSPIVATITEKLQFRQCLAYLYINFWGLRSIPELCYAALPAYCLLSNTSFMPSVSEPAILIPSSIFVIYNIYTLSEYLCSEFSFHTWWNNQRMSAIISTARLFGVLSVVMKLLGLSETIFEVTPKDQSTSDSDTDADAGKFTFDDSLLFLPGTTLVLMHMTALTFTLLRVLSLIPTRSELRLGDVICSAWVVLSLLPFAKGLFEKGKYGIPSSTICKSVVILGIFMYFCL